MKERIQCHGGGLV